MTARYLAVKALMRQEQNGYANLVLDSELKACKPPLSPRDAAFASGIFYTVLERRSLLDWMLAQFSKRPLEKLDAPVAITVMGGGGFPLCGPFCAPGWHRPSLWMFRCLRLSMNRSS